MLDSVQQAFQDWKRREAAANSIAAQGVEAREARQAATEAWRIYWERRWQVEQGNGSVEPIQT